MELSSKEKTKELIEYFAELIPPIQIGMLLERDWKTAKKIVETLSDEICIEYVEQVESKNKSNRQDFWLEVKKESKIF